MMATPNNPVRDTTTTVYNNSHDISDVIVVIVSDLLAFQMWDTNTKIETIRSLIRYCEKAISLTYADAPSDDTAPAIYRIGDWAIRRMRPMQLPSTYG